MTDERKKEATIDINTLKKGDKVYGVWFESWGTETKCEVFEAEVLKVFRKKKEIKVLNTKYGTSHVVNILDVTHDRSYVEEWITEHQAKEREGIAV